MTLRQLGPADWSAFPRVRLVALAESPGNFFASLEEARALPDRWWQDLLRRDGTAIFGLFEGEALVGITGVFTDRDDPTGQTAALGMTWLDPAYRGRGIGHRFYTERLAWARTRGFARAEVSHRAGNEASRRAMLRAGFREIGSAPYEWPDGEKARNILYELQLA